MTVLCLSILVGLSATVSHVHCYCTRSEKKREEGAVKTMVMLIFFEFIWPILGVYPAVFVWFEYKALIGKDPND